MSSRKPKKKIKQSQPPAQRINKETYFSSDRIKRLPPGDYYVALIEVKLEQSVLVIITRDHVNGKYSFASFAIQIYTGQILDCHFDFNLERDILEEMKDSMQMEQFEDIASLEFMIYEAIATNDTLNLPSLPELRFCKNILQFEYEELKTTPHQLLFPFQNKTEDEINSVETTQLLDKRLLDHLPNYDVQAVKGWSAKDWSMFIDNLEGLEYAALVEPTTFNPVLFIFEHNQLPRETPCEQYMAAIERLENSHPIITKDYIWDKSYGPVELEIILQQSLIMEIEMARSPKEQKIICRKIEDFLQKYQENTIIPYELFKLYESLNYTNKAYKLICDYYIKQPNHQYAVVYYFKSLIDNNKPNLIQKFLSKGILLEDHLPEQQNFIEAGYHYYYRLLASYLYTDDWWNESWRLITYFNNLPEIQNEPALLYEWRKIYFYPAENIFNWLKTLSKHPDIKAEMIETIIAAKKSL